MTIPRSALPDRLRALAAIACSACALALPAQQPSANSDGPSGVGATSRRATTTNGHAIPVPLGRAEARSGPITIDGRLDDAAWTRVEPLSGFTQGDPEEGKPASQHTEVRFLFDDDALYVGARMFDTEGAKGVRTQLTRRDAQFDSDFFSLIIDGYHDHQSRAFFTVNPSGSRQDQIGTGNSCCDSGWDPIWQTAAHVDSAGWSAEMRIPLSQLRFSRDSLQTWGIQMWRFIQRRQEFDMWSFWKKTEVGGASRFGHLEGVRIATQPRHLEVLPYSVARAKAVRAAPGDPFNDGRTQDVRAGVDLKYLLTPNLTLDATFQPDFGQVEVDPAQVNLSAFETFYEEKRPFFIEGAGVFRFGGTRCMFCNNFSGVESFYSRRIGRAPSGTSLAYAQGPYADVPDASTILGAAKITGRTGNGWTVGLLNATTRQEQARVQREDGSRTDVTVEPLTNFLVGRLKRDFRRGNLVTGLYASSVTRRMTDEFRPMLNNHSEMFGWDLESYWKNRTYSLRATVMASNVSGDPRVITARQKSSARYYQRPDDRRIVDTTATSLQGAGAFVRVGKDGGDWNWEVMGNTRTPGYEVNDIAFQSRADYAWFNGNVARFFSKPTKWYRTLSLIAGGQYQRNYQGLEVMGRDVHAGMFGNTLSGGFFNTFVILRPTLMDERLLRGGPAVYVPGGGYVNMNYGTDTRRRVNGQVQASYSWNTERGFGNSFNATVRYRPTSFISLSAGPSYNLTRAVRQYVQAVGDPTATAFNGTRYVLSGLNQNTLGMDTRMSVTFSPRMTFELYAQPFFATGKYYGFKEYTAPRSRDVVVYGREAGTIAENRNAEGRVTSYTIDPDGAGAASSFNIANPNFSVRSLRGNAVFRWEYRPGSTLFFVWTQTRSSSEASGEFDLGHDARALTAARPDNIFLVKMNWWLSR
ncbi:MAG: carbohydrate binding family 9 domain-containing protein [Gemmatimonadetes bacterium]|nr:carbohydrate binding family 9 domain-containing protein [Gemmatimonadota bacterium]